MKRNRTEWNSSTCIRVWQCLMRYPSLRHVRHFDKYPSQRRKTQRSQHHLVHAYDLLIVVLITRATNNRIYQIFCHSIQYCLYDKKTVEFDF